MPYLYKSQTLTSSVSLAATGVDLGDFPKKVYLQIATATCGNVRVQYSNELTGAYHPVTPLSKTTTQLVDTVFSVDSGVTNCIVEVPVAGRFAKVEATTSTTDTHTTYNWIVSY